MFIDTRWEKQTSMLLKSFKRCLWGKSWWVNTETSTTWRWGQWKGREESILLPNPNFWKYVKSWEWSLSIQNLLSNVLQKLAISPSMLINRWKLVRFTICGRQKTMAPMISVPHMFFSAVNLSPWLCMGPVTCFSQLEYGKRMSILQLH